MESKLNNKAT